MAEVPDSELEAIRAKRMSELQKERQGQEGEEKARVEEMQNMLLSQILSQDARARLNSIAIVKPDKAKVVETQLLRMAQSGQIMDKLTEAQLIDLLERFNSQMKSDTKVKFQRRKVDSDSDDD
ncbi:Programmed cell death protein 5-like protein [Oopsacas minuta]|uniref:Programmed cell death protein 5-like protein n=1 Tax=Oopsacas minuta TaxID=111878 RepID=A0AAV7J8L8_9METZ|nr:Programmed cell death protein 5-like protein [Oopsacas minuta]